MSYGDPRIDLPLLGYTVQAYANTLNANWDRQDRLGADRYDFSAEEISPAEVNLAALFLENGVEGWEQQYSLGPYWPDFYFTEQRLVVEVDGAFWHQDQEHERKRDKVMRQKGAAQILHLRAIEVFTDGLGCVERVKLALERPVLEVVKPESMRETA